MGLTRRGALGAVAAGLGLRAASAQPALVPLKAAFCLGVERRDRPIDPYAVGLSFEKIDLMRPWFSAAALPLNAKLLSDLGRGVLRFGGLSVELASWGGADPKAIAIRPSGVEALAQLLQATGWKAIYGLNLTQNTPEAMIDEAGHVAARLGPSLLAFEIGNEPNYLPGSGTRYMQFPEFMEKWSFYASTLRARFPDLPLLGPSTVGAHDWIEPFARKAPKNLWLSQHYYRGSGKDPASTAQKLLSPDPALAGMISSITATARATQAHGAILDEANSYYMSGRPGVSDAFASALWSAWFMAETTSRGIHSVNFHSGRQPYTPIFYDAAGGPVEIRPVYYGLMLFARFRRAFYCDVQTVSPARDDVRCFASAGPDGRYSLLLFNLNFDSDVECALSGLQDGPMKRSP